MSAGKRGTRTILFGFTPWIVWGVITAAGWTLTGLAAGLAIAGTRLILQARSHRIKAIEAAAAAFFAVQFAVAGPLGWPEAQRYMQVLLYGMFAVMAWATLAAGIPFTLQYAREDWPQELWDQPVFQRTNTILTALWAVLFTAAAASNILAASDPSVPGWLYGMALPLGAVAMGVTASIAVPRIYPRLALQRRVDAEAGPSWPMPAFAPVRPKSPDSHDVVAVGAGIGGLTSAALLAQRGLKVLVLDHHYLPGGLCTSWPRYVGRGAQRQTYIFDAGVHDVSGLGPNGPVRWLLKRLDLEERLDWRHMGHEYFLPGLHIKVPRDARDYEERLAARFPAEQQGLRGFFSEMEAVYREMYQDISHTGGMPLRPSTVDEMLAYPLTHPHAMRWMDTPFEDMLSRFIRDPQLKGVLSALTGYLTDRPEQLTAGAIAPIFGYYFDGGYYPVGGSQALADALVSAIEQRGGEVRLRTAVRRIVVENGKATGVELADGRVERAEAVISNADVTRTFLELVGPEHLPPEFVDDVRRLQPSASCIHICLGVDFVPDLEPITVVQTDRGSVYIAIPSKVDTSLAPPGHSALELIALAPPDVTGEWDRKSSEYRPHKREAADALIALAEEVLPSLRAHIRYRQEGTPASVERYAWTLGGAIYGPAFGWRPHAKSPLPNLVLAGSGVFPGAGVEAVVISGMIATELLCPAYVRPALLTTPPARLHDHPEKEESAVLTAQAG